MNTYQYRNIILRNIILILKNTVDFELIVFMQRFVAVVYFSFNIKSPKSYCTKAIAMIGLHKKKWNSRFYVYCDVYTMTVFLK